MFARCCDYLCYLSKHGGRFPYHPSTGWLTPPINGRTKWVLSGRDMVNWTWSSPKQMIHGTSLRQMLRLCPKTIILHWHCHSNLGFSNTWSILKSAFALPNNLLNFTFISNSASYFNQFWCYRTNDQWRMHWFGRPPKQLANSVYLVGGATRVH